MPAAIQSPTTSVIEDDSLSLNALNALSVQTADAFARIKGLFRAYQCLENLVMPRGPQSTDLALSDKDLYILLTTLNEPMRRQLEEAQQAFDRLAACISDNT